jgi:hypothetical protein
MPVAPVRTGTGAAGVPAGLRADVSWGQAGATHAQSDLVRLSALKAAGRTIVIFLGVKDDGRTAVFLLAGDASPTGDGKCLPSTAHCQAIELRQGESEFFDVTSGDAGVTQYELDVNGVGVRHAADAAAAAKAKERVSTTGKAALRQAIDSGDVPYIGHYDYSTRRGALIVHSVAKAASVARPVPAGDVPAPIAPTP